MTRARAATVASVVVVAVALTSCGSSHTATRRNAPSPVSEVTSTRPRATTTTTVPAYVSLTAQANVAHLSVYDHPNAQAPAQVLDNPWLVDPSRPSSSVPQVFLVESRRAGWVHVLLPVRPNGTSGWVRAADVTLSPVVFKIRVELGTHRITVFSRGARIYTGPVADGAPNTPTPVGHYYIRVLIKAPDPNTVYGPYAYGLSSHSDALASFDGGDAEIGIHGNNDASVLGTSVTHGCIRIDNDEIARLASTLPLGTPVDIQP